MVSFLITTYNSVSFIEDTVDSLLNQDYQDIEIIAVDDGSQDGTVERLNRKAEKDNRLKVFTPGRLGRAKALNFGVDKCQGEFIAINDADDVSDSTRISKQVQFLETNNACVLVGSRIKIRDLDSGKLLNYSDQRPLSDAAIKKFMSTVGQPIQHSAVLMRRSVVMEVGGYNEDISFMLDRDLFIRMGIKGELRNLEEPLITLGRSSSQYFMNNYTGTERVKLDFRLKMKALRVYRAPVQWRIKVVVTYIYSRLINLVRITKK